MNATAARFQSSIDRARERGGARAVRQLGVGRFTVQGRGGLYALSVGRDGTITCTCPAGQHDRPCWHAAAVWTWALGRGGARALSQPTAPAADFAAVFGDH